MPSAARQRGLSLDESLVGSRARSDVQMRNSTQATAILCTIKPEGLHRVLSEPGSEYATLRGRPTESKLKVALSGIADSSRVATDNHARYSVHPFLTRRR